MSRLITLPPSKVRDRSVPLLKEAQVLLAPLEEMEKNITGFYQALEKASRITAAREPEAAGDFKQKCQVSEARPKAVQPAQFLGHSTFKLK